jgi:hypothetical protein
LRFSLWLFLESSLWLSLWLFLESSLWLSLWLSLRFCLWLFLWFLYAYRYTLALSFLSFRSVHLDRLNLCRFRTFSALSFRLFGFTRRDERRF